VDADMAVSPGIWDSSAGDRAGGVGSGRRVWRGESGKRVRSGGAIDQKTTAPGQEAARGAPRDAHCRCQNENRAAVLRAASVSGTHRSIATESVMGVTLL